MDKPDLTKLTEAELRKLQAEHAPDIANASDPKNEYPNKILAEGKRRGLWH